MKFERGGYCRARFNVERRTDGSVEVTFPTSSRVRGPIARSFRTAPRSNPDAFPRSQPHFRKSRGDGVRALARRRTRDARRRAHLSSTPRRSLSFAGGLRRPRRRRTRWRRKTASRRRRRFRVCARRGRPPARAPRRRRTSFHGGRARMQRYSRRRRRRRRDVSLAPGN